LGEASDMPYGCQRPVFEGMSAPAPSHRKARCPMTGEPNHARPSRCRDSRSASA